MNKLTLRSVPLHYFPWWRMLFIRLVGKRKIGVDFGSLDGESTVIITAYKYKGVTYITDIRYEVKE